MRLVRLLHAYEAGSTVKMATFLLAIRKVQHVSVKRKLMKQLELVVRPKRSLFNQRTLELL